MAYAVLKRIASEKPEELRQLFQDLYDENEDLFLRIKRFKGGMKSLYKSIGGENADHQDERSIATYLTYRYPEKYTFYQAKIYSALCEILEVEKAPVNKKYIHYLSLLDEFVDILESDEKAFFQEIEKELPNSDVISLRLLAQNIVFSVTNAEAETKIKQNQFNKDELSIYIKQVKRIISKFNLKKGDPRLVFRVRDDSYVFITGQRFGLALYRNNADGDFGVLTNKPIGEKYESFEGEKPPGYFNYLNSDALTDEVLNKMYQAIQLELERSNKSSFLKYNDSAFENLIFEEMTAAKKIQQEYPINQILYGPPGTGKTFRLKNEYFSKYTTKESSLSKREHFEEIVRDLTWWQVIAIALLEKNNQSVSDLVKSEWVAFKANISESKNVRATVWGTLQIHAFEESKTVAYTQRNPPLIFDKNDDKSWRVIEEDIKEQTPELLEILDEVSNFNPNPDKLIKRYIFTTFHQSYSYEDFIEGIKPVMSEVETNDAIGYQIEDGIFKELCKRAESDPENRYAIFIDEINRANVSAVLGELITLIEKDKRIGEDNELKVKLPYSKKHFGVPANLDIYGTMNTADRSVEALDTALRRRFSFEEMLPNPKKLKGQEIDGIKLDELLTTINDRIEVLIDRDHTIGHSYLMHINDMKGLRFAFKNKIIPLLQEYFYGDYQKMEMVIGSAFFNQEKKNKKVEFAVKNYELDEPTSRYEIRDVCSDDFDMKQALVNLLNPSQSQPDQQGGNPTAQ